MSSEINRIRDLVGRTKVRSGDQTEGATDLPLDHQLTFCPSKEERWTFEGDHVYFNGTDVNEMVNGVGNDIRYLSGLSAAVDQYRQHVWNRGGKSAAKFNGAIEALLGKILGKLGSIYDGLFRGVRFEYSNGDLWINDVNPDTVLKLYMLKPTSKARCYLIGLRNKLGLIINAQNGSARYDGVKPAAEELFRKISCALDQIPTDDAGRALPAHRPS